MKEFAGTVISQRIIETSRRWARGGQITDLEKAKLARSGINFQDAVAITDEIYGARTNIRGKLQKPNEFTGKGHGERVGDLIMPNTSRWENLEAQRVFRGALAQDVNRTIVTPGIGDRALWTSTEFGSLIAQFKSFAQAMLHRGLTAGLQERDANFWIGTGMLVGMGGVVNELKRISFGDTRPEDAGEKLVEAIDRSGILGWFMDANNSFERVTDYKAGLRAMMSGGKPFQSSFGSKASAVFGPTGQTLDNLFRVTRDLTALEPDRYTAERAQRLVPFQNIPWLTPAFDATRETIF